MGEVMAAGMAKELAVVVMNVVTTGSVGIGLVNVERSATSKHMLRMWRMTVRPPCWWHARPLTSDQRHRCQLRSKDQAMTMFMEFQVWAEAEAERKLGTFHTDYGGEFTTRTFLDYCAKMGIQRHLTAPYTPEQNGIMEQRNQTIMSMARSMLKAMMALGWLWGEAVVTSMHILNRCQETARKGMDGRLQWVCDAHGAKAQVVQEKHDATGGCNAVHNIIDCLWYLLHNRPDLMFSVRFLIGLWRIRRKITWRHLSIFCGMSQL
jgi:hypothetical protein